MQAICHSTATYLNKQTNKIQSNYRASPFRFGRETKQMWPNALSFLPAPQRGLTGFLEHLHEEAANIQVDIGLVPHLDLLYTQRCSYQVVYL